MVVAGEVAQGSLVSDDAARRASEALAGAVWVVRVAGAGHCVRRDDLSSFLGFVDGLLTEVDG